MAMIGQTLSGDLEGGVLVCGGGSLGPVGSPGWRRRDARLEAAVKLRGQLRRRDWRAGSWVRRRSEAVVTEENMMDEDKAV